MARKLKVFCGTKYIMGGQYRCILATTTKKNACVVLDVSMGELNNYWYWWEDTQGNDHTREQALAQPEIPLYCNDKECYKKDVVYKKLEEMI